ncbi:MAG: TonB-dependent receptor-like protein [Gammaproteobacteria bacterium]|nr:TonB-dependent receptor-like protein [Gammaproteobacteria bacterium]
MYIYRSKVASCVFGILTGLAATAAVADQSVDQPANQPANQPADTGAKLEEIVITGTSIRGAAPVGANLITVGRDQIAETGAQTMQQILSSVPAVTGFGNASQGGFGSADASGTYAPTIHGLGASASNGTLVLIDGHRLPLSGINHTLADPNIIAPLAVDRVEVLPDGASSTYGSDAVAGVINIITRRNFKGFEASAQEGFANGYNTQDAGFLWGDSWADSSVMVTYNYSRRSALSNGDRSFTAANHTAQGGGDFASYNCGPASAQVGGKYYLYPYTGAAATSPSCDYTGVADTLPEDIRHTLLVKATHEVSDRLSLNLDVVYSNEANTAQISRGTLIATAYGPGSTPPGGAGQINPFFQGPPGVTSELVSFDANNLLGRGAENQAGAKTFMVTPNAQLQLGGDWVGTLGATIGQNQSTYETVGVLCTSCANLGLNGTTNSSGNPLTPSIAGTTTTVTTLPLTAANAIDVWNPAGSNLTSAALLRELTDSHSWQLTNQSIKDFSLKFDGPLFHLPGGTVKAAVGGEYVIYTIYEQVVRSSNTGPSTLGSQALDYNWGRNVKSGYAELLVPVVGNENAVPLVHRLDVNISGRYDDYSDFGSTKNPKFALTWDPLRGVSLRGNFARSFTAPALTSSGARGVTAESGYLTASPANGVAANLSVPNTFPGAIGLPGCTAATPVCTINSPTVTGIGITGPNQALKPESGKTWSLGLDVAPPDVPGLRLSATYWNVDYTGMITSPQAIFALSSPALSPLLTLYPGGATAAQIAAAAGGRPQTGALPQNVYFIYSYQQQNALNLKSDGIDADASYLFDTSVGTFSADLSGSVKLKMMQQFGSGGQWFSILNTSGFNTTFPSNRLAARLDLGWRMSGVSAHVIANYEGSYYNWNGSAPYPLRRDAAFAPIGGGQPVVAYTTFDFHAAYNFGASGVMANTEIDLTGTNILNKAPPFFNTAIGYDTFNANPIGRLVTVGISKKW